MRWPCVLALCLSITTAGSAAAEEVLPTNPYAEPETYLAPVERPAWPDEVWNGEISAPGTPTFIQRRITEHSNFVQPFLVPSVFPEFSARLMSDGGYSTRTQAGEFDQFVYGSLYLFDFYAPLLNVRSNEPISTDHVRVNLKAPMVFGPHVFTLFVGGNIPSAGAWTHGGGFNVMFGYALGGPVTFQARAGVGYDQLIAEDIAPQATSALADGSLGIAMGDHAQLLLQADGRKLLGSPGGTLRLWPGVRFFPLNAATVSIALGAQVWLDTFDATGHYIDSFGTRRAGAFLEVGWIFL